MPTPAYAAVQRTSSHYAENYSVRQRDLVKWCISKEAMPSNELIFGAVDNEQSASTHNDQLILYYAGNHEILIEIIAHGAVNNNISITYKYVLIWHSTIADETMISNRRSARCTRHFSEKAWRISAMS